MKYFELLLRHTKQYFFSAALFICTIFHVQSTFEQKACRSKTNHHHAITFKFPISVTPAVVQRLTWRLTSTTTTLFVTPIIYTYRIDWHISLIISGNNKAAVFGGCVGPSRKRRLVPMWWMEKLSGSREMNACGTPAEIVSHVSFDGTSTKNQHQHDCVGNTKRKLMSRTRRK